MVLTSIIQAAAQQITALIVLGNPNYSPTEWETALFSWAILMLAIFANTVLYRKLPLLEGIVTFIHVLGFFAFLIVLWYVFLAQHIVGRSNEFRCV